MYGVPNLSDVRVRPCPAHKVSDAQSLNDSKVAPAEYLERMNGRAKLDVRSVRGEHKVDMRGTVPDAWSLS